MACDFSVSVRSENINRLKAEVFDLAIIGGGITGAGVARDAASRGMKVALVEANDFASGTSSRSSKLIHGGIRYLENLEFGLVHEALTERRLLFSMAPHLVHPLRFVLPLYEGGRVGMFKMGLGMWLYDALAMFEMPEFHERLSPEQSIERLPVLQPKGLKGSYVYSDAYMDDDRLVLETLRSAHGLGAVAVSYVSAEGAVFENEKIKALKCRDGCTGDLFQINAKHVVASVGPWTDQVAKTLVDDWRARMRPTKGIHLTLSRSRLPLKQAVVMAADNDRRIVFGIPRHEMVIVGTTDTDYSGDPRNVHSTREDVDYLLQVVNEYFPGARLTKSDIIASYAGVRPLVGDGSGDESQVSREHVILPDPRNITFVMGGKYTTYRHMAEQTVEAVLSACPVEQVVKFIRNQTKDPLNNRATVETLQASRLMVSKWAKEYDFSAQTIEALVERHALEAEDIIKTYGHKVSGQNPSALWQLEAHHAIDTTMCFHLVDFYLRRVPLFLADPEHGFQFLDSIASTFAERLNWSEAEKQTQVDALYKHKNHELAWQQS
ncbi:MAG: glycerol-3-phosphate dehydrogenase/oxidase [Pseudobdellovibrionaceae bacterium]|nr:glycerol-3-phosphate dehydrogenase/oxidase [Bdellovibrionales bacterium]USN49006.1 MAG: glycerol-3-phosphate dehydrogenase/oxidase [Pseudobdellovibrionaceae bacterium]